MRYADETYSETARYGLGNNPNTFDKYQPWLYKLQKGNVAKVLFE